MLRRLASAAALVALVALAAAPAVAQEPAASAPPPVVINKSEAPDVTAFYLNVPWGPATFATMERPSESFYNKRTWPFARLESAKGFSLDGTQVPAGNYALVFHPNTPDDAGMSLEVRKIEMPEFLQPGNVMTRTPEGVTVHKAPIKFDLAASTAPALKVELAPQKDGVELRVQYGNKLLVKELKPE